MDLNFPVLRVDTYLKTGPYSAIARIRHWISLDVPLSHAVAKRAIQPLKTAVGNMNDD